jgi:hypothetical protein
MASGVITAGVPAASAAPKQQKVEGTILFPARHPDGCYTGLQRHLVSLGGEASSGVLGWAFRVDKKTWNKPFTLEGTGVGYVDLDLTFYLGEFATQEEWVASPAPAAPASIGFEEHGQTGEAGPVPKFAVWGLVCIYADETAQPPSAVAVDFTYTAGKGVKIPKG